MTSGTVGLLDTSTVIGLSVLRDPGALPETPLISTVTLAELSVGPLVATTAAERANRQAVLQQAEADFDPLPFDAAAARAFGRVAAALRGAGRKPRARAYDAMIAAVALARGLPLYTANPADLPDLAGLVVVPVPLPAAAAVAVRELADVTRRADNPALLGALPDLGVAPAEIVEDLEAGRSDR